MGINALQVSENMKKTYINYLSTTFEFENKNIMNEFIKELNKKDFLVKGPILEITPTFKKGKSLLELLDEGIISKEFKNLKNFSLQRPLYLHQEKAIKKVLNNRNIIVSTGTGSGKTESFLIPILNYLLIEKENGILNAGVRALILYPMNALASDQLKRLRNILEDEPSITFGAYTGETPEYYKDALIKYKETYGREPLINELISREQMKKNPPNILITNYSMLEYLMLRPEDNTLFSGKFGESWKYIVIDEAHMYSGAKGIEICMLLRRLQVEINKLENGINFILTSASLGRGKADYPEIAKFAEKLCSSPFAENDIIEAKRTETIYSEYIEYPITLYNELAFEIKNNNLSEEKINEILSKYKIKITEEYKDIKELLFNIFSKDKRIYKIKENLKDRYLSLEKAASLIDPILKVSDLIDIVEITNKAQKNDEVLLPGRYHIFFRSLEGAYVTFKPTLKMHLTPQSSYNYKGKNYRAFEIGVCQNCKKIYLIGIEEIDDEGYERVSILKNYMEDLQNVNYYLIDDLTEKYKIDDEDTEDEKLNLEKYTLCTCCGRISPTVGKKICNCGQENYIIVTKVTSEEKNKSGKLHKCISCGKVSTTSSIVRKIVAGNEAATSVILDSLYKNIEGKITKEEKREEIKKDDDLDFLFGISDDFFNEEDITENTKKQVLVFSDSRQNAAYFAGYFDFTYNKLLRRQLLISILKEEQNNIENYTLKDLTRMLVNKFEKYYKELSRYDIEQEAWKTVLYEFMGLDGKNGLEDIGILTYVNTLSLPSNGLKALERFKITEKEFYNLIDILLHGLRKVGAVYDNDQINKVDWEEYFGNVSKNSNFTLEKTEYSKAWIPNEGKENQRTEYLKKIGIINLDEIKKFLSSIFTILISDKVKILVKDATGGYKLNPEKFKLISFFSKNHKYYQCNKCKKITPYNIRNKCAVYKCDGELEEINIEEIMKENHYWKLYMDSNIQYMRIAEHTAQLSKDEARKKQTDFVNGNINILSCSTTFEVGVDVGELETVFMRNVPPTPANYVQRAGRAGRRTDSTAFAVTYSSLKSHDFINFDDPTKMISGKISPPIFEIENYKIIKRHLYATILSEFWRKNQDYYGKNFTSFIQERTGIKPFQDYIKSKDKELLNKLSKIIPRTMKNQFDLEEMNWVKELTSADEKGSLDTLIQQFYLDIQLYRNKIEELIKNKKLDNLSYLNRNLKLMEDRKLIEVLSRGNIIPKYGFPVDTVALEVEDVKVDLTRDLQQALIDYVPGSEVIANGKIFKSRYVKQVPNKALDKYEYRICENCHQITRVKKFVDKDLSKCNNCDHELKKYFKYSSEYQIPIFGFIAEHKSKDSTTKKPERVAKIEKFYVGSLNNDTQIKNLEINKHLFELHYSKSDKMAVIGMGKGYGFLVCPTCGYSEVITDINTIDKKKIIKHKSYYGRECNTYLERTDLGYEFETDVVLINTSELDKILRVDESSVLYSFLEGMSRALSIERTDIDGCFYGINNKRFLVIYDKVPGGAGHSKRLLELKNLEKTLLSAYEIVKNCKCGEETACYSCLKNYNNQWYHDELSRKKAIDFYKRIF